MNTLCIWFKIVYNVCVIEAKLKQYKLEQMKIKYCSVQIYIVFDKYVNIYIDVDCKHIVLNRHAIYKQRQINIHAYSHAVGLSAKVGQKSIYFELKQ